MSITLYEEPNYEGESFTFDPKNVNHIFYSKNDDDTYSYKLVREEKIKVTDLFDSGFIIDSVKNESENYYYLLIVDIDKYKIFPIYGSTKDTEYEQAFWGYIKIMKHPNSYKNEMITFICFFIVIILAFGVLFVTGYIKMHTSTIEY